MAVFGIARVHGREEVSISQVNLPLLDSSNFIMAYAFFFFFEYCKLENINFYLWM